MKRGRMRLWRDELNTLPEYSSTMPTGVCLWKCWKSGVEENGKFRWIVGCYGWRSELGHRVLWFEVDLLQGPRRSMEMCRLKFACTPSEMRARGEAQV